MKKVVIQCCARKHEDAGFLSLRDGRRVCFVARPDLCPSRKGLAYFRPDDVNPDTGGTWREYLVNYNRKGGNPENLLRASDLYKRPVYQLLAENSRWETYILSAGWGMVKADFLLPSYDITFTPQARCPWKARRPGDKYKDFKQLTAKEDDTVYFFGGRYYLGPFYELSGRLPARKVVYYRSRNVARRNLYEYIRYNGKMMTNWHYKCAEDFINGRIRG